MTPTADDVGDDTTPAPAVAARQAPLERATAAGGECAAPSKQVYLRTVYPLNPGIPHYVDVPGGW